MTNTDYVSAETAKLLKEVGYRKFKSKTLIGEYNMVHLWDAQKWLREEYGIHICDCFETDELALDSGIARACEMIKNGKIKK